ncbi:prephenate dehydrogenase [Stenoxybacter acetivorans]|uniref:prephenate dehydrogenase n=1 Tax=Stenoxybacter acetivorans TaxID=422441 RepID=UPI000566A793|nr:prephenate dehydrogenase [Stenoxybacter acetivorans]
MNKLVVIGVGLIGGSLALDLKRQGKVREVLGIDVDADNLARAAERKVIDDASVEINAESLADADVVLIATPVSFFADICRRLASVLPENAVVTDVGSTKQPTLQAFKQFLPQHYPRCVAAHPIAGSDRHGALAAQFGLFERKKCIVCPHEQQDSGSLSLIADVWQSVGAALYYQTAAEHDAVFASVSHLPHLLAYAYVHQIADAPNRQELLHFAGSGFRDFTRIAASHPSLWADICLANRDTLQSLLNEQQAQLCLLQDCLQRGDAAALRDYFQEAKAARDDWQTQQDG